jgi:Trp operon repressor
LGDDGFEETAEQKYARKLKEKSHYAQCFQMFKDGKSLIDVVIDLDMEADIVKTHYSDYLDLRNMKNLESIYKDIKNDFSLFIHLYRRIKKEELNKQDITEILENQKELKDLENRVRLFNEHIVDLQSQRSQLEREILEKEKYLSDLN